MFHNQRSSAVVQSTLLELLKRNQQDAEDQKKTVHVILFNHMNMHELQEYVKKIKILYDKGIRVRICPDEEILNHFQITDLARQIGVDDFITLRQLEQERDNIHHLYIPILSFSAVSDILRFNDMRISIRTILWALMKGKKVTALAAGADPHDMNWRLSGLDNGTPFLKRQMTQQLQQLKGFGIQLINKTDSLVDHFIRTNKDDSPQVITAPIIEKEVKIGNRIIRINKKTIITPLARDIAKQHQITFDEDKGG